MNKLLLSYRDDLLALAKKNGLKNVRVFGSMVRDDARLDSDVDFLVELEEGKTGLALGGFQIDASELLQRKVDVVTEKSLHPKIHDRVIHQAQLL